MKTEGYHRFSFMFERGGWGEGCSAVTCNSTTRCHCIQHTAILIILENCICCYLIVDFVLLHRLSLMWNGIVLICFIIDLVTAVLKGAILIRLLLLLIILLLYVVVVLTDYCYVDIFIQGAVSLCHCANVLSRIFFCDIRERESGSCSFFCVVQQSCSSSISAALVKNFTPRDHRWRETFNTAYQIQSLALNNTCILGYYDFLHIYDTKTHVAKSYNVVKAQSFLL